MDGKSEPKCLACGRTSSEVPLLSVQFQQSIYYICPQDFPILIHQPQKLAGKLPGVENLTHNEE
jgi:hypothetical protein